MIAENVKLFEGKKLLITGGTGSFGKNFLRFLSNFDLDEIRIFSRDEKKQDDLRRLNLGANITFHIGDVRDFSKVKNVTKSIDYVFHAAALKQVPSCEFFPEEALKTNAIGSNNVADACLENSVKKLICLSTDKAVYPINAMGITKALMEKIILSKARVTSDTIFCVTRYGNVMASRGSVIPLFLDQLEKRIPLSITNPNMTRFLMSLIDAVHLVDFAFKNGENGDIFVQKSPASTIDTLAEALHQIVNHSCDKVDKKIIGTRHAEKLYEVLLSSEEMQTSIDLGNYYRVPIDTRSLEYHKYVEKGLVTDKNLVEYTSHNTERLDIEQTKALLIKLPLMRKYL
jgi:UDP-glucose 4-epimerase